MHFTEDSFNFFERIKLACARLMHGIENPNAFLKSDDFLKDLLNNESVKTSFQILNTLLVKNAFIRRFFSIASLDEGYLKKPLSKDRMHCLLKVHSYLFGILTFF